MPLHIGAQLGAYHIVAPLGRGGMGEVYRARDTKLQREVALKILPESFAGDADRVARFEREARTLAALNHPHIAQIHGLEESDGLRALVMELVEGEDLSQRIARGPIPLDEALPIARQIADALEAAHEQGIIHRDLKPANIKVRDNGTVKVLDFGLAKVVEGAYGASGAWGASGASGASGAADPPGAALMNSPTITSPALTQMGVILGTAAYMSPEQAKGKPADKRSDVWAFGCVLFEMLSGRRAFEGDDVSETLAAVLRAEPDWRAVPSSTPVPVSALIKGCLTKDVKTRVGDIAVARFAIEQRLPDSPAPSRRWVVGASMAAVLLLVVAFGLARSLRPASAPAPLVRFALTGTGEQAISTSGPGRDLVMTPDGSRLVFKSVAQDGEFRLMVRSFDQLEATPLVRFPGASFPEALFVSPDGRWLGYTAAAELRKVPLSGGSPLTICRPGGQSRGAAWLADGTIIFATAATDTGLFSVPAAGGEPKLLTTPDVNRGELDHVMPAALPGGESILLTVMKGANRQIDVLNLSTGARKMLIPGGADATYVEGGFLVYGAAGGLSAVRFDAERLEVIGDPIQLTTGVSTKTTGMVNYAVSGAGAMAYVPGSSAGDGPPRSLLWVDRQGREQPINMPTRTYAYARVSPDGTRLALAMRDQDSDIWTWDLERGVLTRLTSSTALDTAPVWMRDGRRIVFASQDVGVANLYLINADAAEKPRQLTSSPLPRVPTSVSPDGTTLVVWTVSPVAATDIGRYQFDANTDVEPLVQTPFAEQNGEISPDGRWLAYQSDESGRLEVYVRPFPNVTGGRWTISTSGGKMPAWARDGRELFYFDGTSRLTRVAVQTGDRFSARRPETLLDAKYFSGGFGVSSRTYDIALDGQRFLMIKDNLPPERVSSSLVVELNWRDALRARFGSQ